MSKTATRTGKGIRYRSGAGRTQTVAEARGYTLRRAGRNMFTLLRGRKVVATGDLATVHFSIPGAPGMGRGLMLSPESIQKLGRGGR